MVTSSIRLNTHLRLTRERKEQGPKIEARRRIEKLKFGYKTPLIPALRDGLCGLSHKPHLAYFFPVHAGKPRFNIWGSEVRKKEKAYEDEKYAAACRYMLSATCDDEDDYIPLVITPDLPIEEPDNSLNMGDEHLDTIPATESDEVI
ncbi:hypothetical protein Tco_1410673 [Tanacetum coccineum]